jgi:hypothetical protein
MVKQTILIAPLITVLLLGACSKLEKQTQKSKEKTEMKIISEQARVFTFYEYGKDITEDDFLKNEHDDADQAFNYVNHAMTLGLLDIYQNNPDLWLHSWKKSITVKTKS